MKIYSKYTDYYDNIGFNTSEDRVWERKREYVKLNIRNKFVQSYTKTILTQETDKFLSTMYDEKPRITIVKNNTRYTSYEDSRDYTIVIGFCGKLYLGMVHHRKTKSSYYPNDHYATYIDFDTYVSEYEKSGNDGKLVIDKEDSWFVHNMFNKKSVNDWNNKYHSFKGLENIFIELNTPIFILKPENSSVGLDNVASVGSHLIINPCLKEYKLQSIFDPYTAHQEVDMFLNNVLLNIENNDIKRTDDLIRDSKGMDKFSFKQCGPKERKRKK